MKRFFLVPSLVLLVLIAPASVPHAIADVVPSLATLLKEAADRDEVQMNQLLPEPHVLEDAGKRAALAPKLVPALKRYVMEVSNLTAVQPAVRDDYAWGRSQSLSFLIMLGDNDAPGMLDAMAHSSDMTESQHALRAQLVVRWSHAIKDAAAQSGIANDIEKLDVAHPDSSIFTYATWGFANSSATPQLKERLLKRALAMTSPKAARVRRAIEEQQKIHALSENKTVVLAGKTVDGIAFTTADLKGKVILVDFWATWCGPCVAELPRVRKMYAKYHSKGLEVLGVSNDYSASTLKSYIAKNNMPWPELYDAAAGERHQRNPLTTGRGIQGIPIMFLIDKTGVCRSIEARDEMEELIPRLLAE